MTELDETIATGRAIPDEVKALRGTKDSEATFDRGPLPVFKGKRVQEILMQDRKGIRAPSLRSRQAAMVEGKCPHVA
jgi:hypothetical protein